MAGSGRLDIVQLLTNAFRTGQGGKEPAVAQRNMRRFLNRRNAQGQTGLMLACKTG